MIFPKKLSSSKFLLQIKSLEKELLEVKQEKADLEIMIESIANHSSELNNLYFNKNQELLLYIEQVKQLAATTRLDNNFQSDILEQIAARNDELGKMAEVFLKINKRFKAN